MSENKEKKKVVEKKKTAKKVEKGKTNKKFLPIGTIVMLKGGTKRVMVTGFCAAEEKSNKMWDYSGCVYPEGIISSKQMLLFDHEQIETIHYTGLIDEEEEKFKKALDVLVKELKKIKSKK